MIRLAYVQKKDGEFFSEATYSFWHGCQKLGIETVAFDQDAGIDGLDITKDTVVYGGIGIVRKAFDRLGVPQPTVGEMPPAEVLPFYKRRVWVTTMAEVRQGYEDNRFFFIKPLREHKAFGGHVTSPSIATLQLTARFPDDFPIFASEIMHFIAEYRMFIHEGKIRGSRLYRGDYRVMPDYTVADEFLKTIELPPIAYSLDIGVSESGLTAVVEINDAFSLGHYGFPSVPYTNMVLDRWQQIVGTL